MILGVLCPSNHAFHYLPVLGCTELTNFVAYGRCGKMELSMQRKLFKSEWFENCVIYRNLKEKLVSLYSSLSMTIRLQNQLQVSACVNFVESTNLLYILCSINSNLIQLKISSFYFSDHFRTYKHWSTRPEVFGFWIESVRNCLFKLRKCQM